MEAFAEALPHRAARSSGIPDSEALGKVNLAPVRGAWGVRRGAPQRWARYRARDRCVANGAERSERAAAGTTCYCRNMLFGVWHVPLQRYSAVKEGGTPATIEAAARPVMEEKETGEREPVDLRCAEQAELLSLIISGEEEATQEDSDLGGNEKKKKKRRYFSWCFPPQSESAWLSEPQPLSGSQLIRVRDNTMEQHGPSVSVAPINKGSTARRQAEWHTQLPPSGEQGHTPPHAHPQTSRVTGSSH